MAFGHLCSACQKTMQCPSFSVQDTTFILSGWGKANSVAGTAKEHTTGTEKYFGLVAAIQYTDGTTENHYVSFDDNLTDWQYASGIVVPKQSSKTIDTITVHCAYDYNANTAYFDNISLIHEPVQTYSYDEKGNPVAATDGNAKTAYEYFSGTSKLKSYTTPSGTKHELEYSGNNLSRDTQAGVSQNYYYSSAGNQTQSITRKGYSGDYLASYNEYSNNEQFKTESQDVNGIETNYSYSGTTRNLLSVENAEETTQNYTYYDPKDDTIRYAGRTVNLERRLNEHKRSDKTGDLKLYYAIGGLTYSEARIFEQALILAYNTKNAGRNSILGISPRNKNYGAYLQALYDFVYNEVTNEYYSIKDFLYLY